MCYKSCRICETPAQSIKVPSHTPDRYGRAADPVRYTVHPCRIFSASSANFPSETTMAHLRCHLYHDNTGAPFLQLYSILFQDPHGVENRDHHHTNVTEHCLPHSGHAHGSKDDEHDLDRQREDDVLVYNPSGFPGDFSCLFSTISLYWTGTLWIKRNKYQFLIKRPGSAAE